MQRSLRQSGFTQFLFLIFFSKIFFQKFLLYFVTLTTIFEQKYLF